MGNCFSGNDTSHLREIATRPDDPADVLTAENITAGLGQVAIILNKSRLHISIVTIGGAVNTLLLHSRTSTSDVDFFYCTKTRNDDVSAVINAAEKAAANLGVGKNWLNNHTAVFIQEETIALLYDEAVAQNDVIFSKPGLTVYAAPWRYAITTKLDRLSKTGHRTYDLHDAVVYLHRIVSGHGKPVNAKELKAWAAEFKCTVPTDKLIAQLGTAYHQEYRSNGIIS